MNRGKCKFGADCLCDGCGANDGHFCKVRHEATCAACSKKQFICIKKCTDKEELGK